MCIALSRLASSMNGRFSSSVSSFHSAPSLLEISELCILGFSWAILRRWPLDHTMNAFMGRFTLSSMGREDFLLELLDPVEPAGEVDPWWGLGLTGAPGEEVGMWVCPGGGPPGLVC